MTPQWLAEWSLADTPAIAANLLHIHAPFILLPQRFGEMKTTTTRVWRSRACCCVGIMAAACKILGVQLTSVANCCKYTVHKNRTRILSPTESSVLLSYVGDAVATYLIWTHTLRTDHRTIQSNKQELAACASVRTIWYNKKSISSFLPIQPPSTHTTQKEIIYQ